MIKDIFFALFGYLAGSILFARISSRVFKKESLIQDSRDHNPGTANAFVYGGFACGVFTLVGDLLKGFLPVFLYIQYASRLSYPLSGLPLVLAAPVVGHAFPLYYGFQGGKGIAVTFGSLLGLLPTWQPVAALAFFFIFFSLVLRISPHYHRTLVAYAAALWCLWLMPELRNAWFGFLLICVVVCTRMLTSKEEKEAMKVRLLWMH